MSTSVHMSDDDRARMEEVTLDGCATNWSVTMYSK